MSDETPTPDPLRERLTKFFENNGTAVYKVDAEGARVERLWDDVTVVLGVDAANIGPARAEAACVRCACGSGERRTRWGARRKRPSGYLRSDGSMAGVINRGVAADAPAA